jgi:two-component system capsular synthesis response regulator RcsB
MFKKILVAEDSDSISLAVQQAFEDLSIPEFHHARYCDDAFLKIRRALHDGNPFELLISDLSFLNDGRQEKITSGEALIQEVRKLQPDIRIIAFSVEDRPFRIKSLFDDAGVSGYVFKGRNSISQLKQAIRTVSENGEEYLSPELMHIRKDKTISEIDQYDVQLLRLLAEGLRQEEISRRMKEMDIAPNSVSAIEKRISRLKIFFMANNSVQVVVKAKDLGLI